MSNSALIVVDVQEDFVSGSLAVPDGEQVIDAIINEARAGDYDLVVFTRDWHPADHFSFSDEPEFRDGSWPSHCVQGTPGAEIDPRLREAFPDAPVFSKGADSQVEAYSGFDGYDDEGTRLLDYLDAAEVDDVAVVGLATDYCVKATAIDAADSYFKTTVVRSGVRGVSPDTTDAAVEEMQEHGVRFED